MKKISICVPCYNEQDNIQLLYETLVSEMKKEKSYDYEIVFADNASTDNSKTILRNLAAKDSKVKVIFNLRNYGPKRSNSNGFYRSSGDAVITLAADFQDPPELIHSLLRCWEKGDLVVFGQKIVAKEDKLKHGLRTLYYKIIKYFSSINHYEHVSSLFLLDRSVINVIKEVDDPDIDVHHLIEDLGFHVRLVPYTQELRRAGNSSYNVIRYFDFAITELVNTSYVPLRIATVLGTVMSFLSFLVGLLYFIYKLIFWERFDAGLAPILIGIFFLGSVQLMFLGIIGEYIGAILRKITKRPLVLEEETLNFDNEADENVAS